MATEEAADGDEPSSRAGADRPPPEGCPTLIREGARLGCCGDFGQRNEWILLRRQGWLLITIVDFVRPPVTERSDGRRLA